MTAFRARISCPVHRMGLRVPTFVRSSQTASFWLSLLSVWARAASPHRALVNRAASRLGCSGFNPSRGDCGAPRPGHSGKGSPSAIAIAAPVREPLLASLVGALGHAPLRVAMLTLSGCHPEGSCAIGPRLVTASGLRASDQGSLSVKLDHPSTRGLSRCQCE
jgi:hypothetical protein